TEEAEGTEELPAPAEAAPGEVTIETPKGKNSPADLADLIDKRLGPDLPRGEVEKFFTSFVDSPAFRTSILGWAKKKHGAKPVTHVEKAEFAAWKDSQEGRRVFKAWLDGQWAKVKGRKREKPEEEEEEAPAPTAKAAPGTVRGDLALAIGRNIIHGSDSLESAKREIPLFFKPDEIHAYARVDEAWLRE